MSFSTNLSYLWSGFCLADVAKHMGPVLEVNANLAREKNTQRERHETDRGEKRFEKTSKDVRSRQATFIDLTK